MQVIDLIDKYDNDYNAIKRFYLSIKGKIERQQRFYCEQWWNKFDTSRSTTGVKVMRNMQALVMCYMLKTGNVEKPFNFRPPDGPMQWYLSQNQRLYYSDLQLAHLYGNNEYKKIQKFSRNDIKNRMHKNAGKQKDNQILQYEPFQVYNSDILDIYCPIEESLLDSYGNIKNQQSQYDYEDADKFIDIIVDQEQPIQQQTQQYKNIIKWLCQRVRQLKNEIQQVNDGDQQLLKDILLLD